MQWTMCNAEVTYKIVLYPHWPRWERIVDVVSGELSSKLGQDLERDAQ